MRPVRTQTDQFEDAQVTTVESDRVDSSSGAMQFGVTKHGEALTAMERPAVAYEWRVVWT